MHGCIRVVDAPPGGIEVHPWRHCGRPWRPQSLHTPFLERPLLSTEIMQSTLQPCPTHVAQIHRRPFGSAAPASSRRAPATIAQSACALRSPSRRLRSPQPGEVALQASTTRCGAARQHVAPVSAEISYVMIKPDGVQRALVGEVKPPALPLSPCPSEYLEHACADRIMPCALRAHAPHASCHCTRHPSYIC